MCIAGHAREEGGGAVEEGHAKGAARGGSTYHQPRPYWQPTHADRRERVSSPFRRSSSSIEPDHRPSFPNAGPPMMPNGTGMGMPPVSRVP